MGPVSQQLCNIKTINNRLRMNQVLLRLLELQHERARWLLLAKRQLSNSQLTVVLQKYFVADQKFALEEQQLIQSLGLFQTHKEQEQCLFRRWTIKILMVLEIPNFAIGKLEIHNNLMDIYAELWKFWGQFGAAMKMQWIKIRMKTHQVPVYKLLAQKLICTTRKKFQAKIRAYKIFCRPIKEVKNFIPVELVGSRIINETQSVELTGQKKESIHKYSVCRTSQSVKRKSVTNTSESTNKSTPLNRSTKQIKSGPPHPPPEKQKPRSLYVKKRLTASDKKQTLRSLYEPLDINIDESYSLKISKQYMFKTLLSRNNLPPPPAPLIRKPKANRRANTLSECFSRELRPYKLTQACETTKDEQFTYNRISI